MRRDSVETVSDVNRQQDDIDAAASAWVVRLGGAPLSPAERRALDAWLGKSPRHEAAFAEAEAAWAKMGLLRDAPGALARDHEPMSDAGPAAPLFAAQKGPRQRRPLLPALAIAATLVLTITAASLWFGDPLTLLTADHRTAPGRQAQVSLADGSVVDLGPESAIAVDYTSGERRVVLLAGVAQFTAAPSDHGEARPFVVSAGNGRARALGTSFMVARLGESIEVTVLEHRVEVALAGDEDAVAPVVVSPGRAVRYSEAGLSDVRAVNVQHATAWQRGRLIVDRMTLGEVITHFNRYQRGWIAIADPELASRRVSGVFNMTDPESALATLTGNLRIRSLSVSPLVTLLY